MAFAVEVVVACGVGVAGVDCCCFAAAGTVAGDFGLGYGLAAPANFEAERLEAVA